MASIEVIQGPETGRTVQIAGDEVILGREGNPLRLTDGTVSRQHARLSCTDDTWSIQDVGSVNGTFVNGTKISKSVELNIGDQIRCGRTLLVFGAKTGTPAMDVDENGGLLEASIMASVPASDDSVIIPTPEAGVEAIGNLQFERIGQHIQVNAIAVINDSGKSAEFAAAAEAAKAAPL
ncbi:hypothetical protein LCGC14_2393520, partial [marine sediment metagenome]